MTEISDPQHPELSPAQEVPAQGALRPPSRGRRLWRSIWSWLAPLAAIVVALLVSGLILLLAGYDPLNAYAILFDGAFGDTRTISEVALKATPLILIGGGLAIAFRAGIWNIGAEGQFYAGALLSTLAGVYISGLPAILFVPLVLVLGVVGGALWAMLAGFLKVRFGASEIVTTIMLNYVATIGTAYLVTGPLIEEAGGFPQTARIAEAARLPRILPPTRLNIGFILAIVIAIALYLLLFKSSTGYAIRSVGVNPTAARYAGISVQRNVLLTMAISGGASGLAGAIEITGLTYRLFQSISPGYGFEGIAVALLAGNNPLGAILSGFLFGALRSGSEVMQLRASIPSVMVFAIQGIVVLSVVAFGAYRLRARRKMV
jgi:simple sugar transport system permease protein